MPSAKRAPDDEGAVGHEVSGFDDTSILGARLPFVRPCDRNKIVDMGEEVYRKHRKKVLGCVVLSAEKRCLSGNVSIWKI